MFKDAEARFGGGEGAGGLDFAILDHHHLARLNLAHKLGADDVQRAGFGRERPGAVAEPAKDERPNAQGIAHADQFGARHRDDGKRAFDAAQRVFHPLGDGFLDGARHQMDDAFAVRGGLEDRAAFDQLAAQGGGIGQIAVMGDGRAAHGELAKEGLNIADRGRAFGAGGRIAHMADGQMAGQGFHHIRLREIVAHIAKAPRGVETMLGVVADDAAGLLAAVLQSV